MSTKKALALAGLFLLLGAGLAQDQAQAGEANKVQTKVAGLTEEAMASLMHYPFPGNIREPESTIKRAASLPKGNTFLWQTSPLFSRKKERTRSSAPTFP